jgi:anti-sigma regulatory factor (Ser/Thr protein kinase)
MDAHTLDLTLPAEAESVAEARTRICAAVAPEFGDGELETIKLLVSEVVTNAVRHGDGAAPLELRARWDDEVRVEISDHGDGFRPTPRVGALDEPGGFGLFLVGRLADRWGVETDHGTTVWFVVRRHDEAHSLAST